MEKGLRIVRTIARFCDRRRPMIDEAPLQKTEAGLKPAAEGWFVVNVRDAAWIVNDHFGAGCVFEGPDGPFRQLGINVQVLQPGQPTGLYHDEQAQEDFLVLAGECVLVVEGEERTLRAWDFFHSPAGTEHILVGGGDGPSVFLAVGARFGEEQQLHYPRSEVAARYGASAEQETRDPRAAYAPFPRTRPGRPATWDQLPWA
jgi:uncharacterized cupin superfamily protein